MSLRELKGFASSLFQKMSTSLGRYITVSDRKQFTHSEEASKTLDQDISVTLKNINLRFRLLFFLVFGTKAM